MTAVGEVAKALVLFLPGSVCTTHEKHIDITVGNECGIQLLGKGNRVIVRGLYPCVIDGKVLLRRWVRDKPIYVKLKRDLETIAKDILCRFIPIYSKRWEKCMRHVRIYNQSKVHNRSIGKVKKSVSYFTEVFSEAEVKWRLSHYTPNAYFRYKGVDVYIDDEKIKINFGTRDLDIQDEIQEVAKKTGLRMEPITESAEIWRNKRGLIHRDNDEPAIIDLNGRKEWLKNGKLHRENNQPAVIYPDGYKQWWVNGEFIKDSND